MLEHHKNDLEAFAVEIDGPKVKGTNIFANKEKLFLPISILIAAVLISGTLIYTQNDSQKSIGQNNGQLAAAGQQGGNQPSGPVNVSADDDAYLGDKNAPVTMIEFSDFQCPFCRKFMTDTLPQIKKEYIDTGKVKLVYRDFPLSFHPGAAPAAEGAECAKDQGKFWEMHDAIFNEQEKQGSGTIQFGIADVKKWAAKVELDTAKFNQCLDSGKYKAEVGKDIADGTAAGVSGTPATFINGRLLVGAQPFAAFKAIIDQELKNYGNKNE